MNQKRFMIRRPTLQMHNTIGKKQRNPILNTHSSIKSLPNTRTINKLLCPCKFITHKPKVSKSAFIQNITKILHLRIRSQRPTKLLLNSNNLIKIPQTKPRKRITMLKSTQNILWFRMLRSFQEPIKSSKPLWIFRPSIKSSINIIKGGIFDH